MASIHGPSIAAHPTSFQAHSTPSPRMGFHPDLEHSMVNIHWCYVLCSPDLYFFKVQQPEVSTMAHAGYVPDSYYGHKHTACLCACFITHSFACNEYHGSSSKLPNFIAHALYRPKLHSSVAFAALLLLQCLRVHFPTTCGSSGWHIFITAFMIASKVISDDKYSNKSWSIVSQGMFQLREINWMEHKFCQYLKWELNVDPDTLKELEDMVQKDFTGPGPYPTHILPTISKLIASTSNPFPTMVANNSTFPIPSFNPPLLKPIPPPHFQHQNPQSTYISPPWTPNTQSPCQLDLTSLTSSAKP